jgi:anti-sigma B factor antagonist
MHLNEAVAGAERVIRIVGEVDAASAPELLEATRRMLDGGAHTVVIDCDGIEFIDSAGLNVLVDAHRRARIHGGRVTLRRPSSITRRLLTTTGLDSVLLIESGDAAGPGAAGG